VRDDQIGSRHGCPDEMDHGDIFGNNGIVVLYNERLVRYCNGMTI